MIDLTPLDVRKKREDFRRILRGYDPEEVDIFLQLVAERLEELVKENLTLRERSERLREQVDAQKGRGRAVQEALVTAQELRDQIQTKAHEEAAEITASAGREVVLTLEKAEAEAERIVAEARRVHQDRLEALMNLERKRIRFLKSLRSMLEGELDGVVIEEGRPPLQELLPDLEFPLDLEDLQNEVPDAAVEREVAPKTSRKPRAGAKTKKALEKAAAEMEALKGAVELEEAAIEEKAIEEGGSAAEEASPAEVAGAEGEEDDPVDLEGDPKLWLSTLVERELAKENDEEKWS